MPEPRSFDRDSALFWLFLLLLTALRLCTAAGHFGLGVDEAHYALYGRYLDWSYFDHPPLVGWVQAVFQHLPLPGQIQVRLPAILLSLWTCRLLVKDLAAHGLSRPAVYWGVAALNLTPMFNAMSIALLPDTLLMPLTLLILRDTENVLRAPSLTRWLRLGLWLGLAGLSKYTAVVYLPALAGLFVYRRQLRELLRPRLWAGVLVSLVLVLPVLYWNIRHDFASFRYQGDHVLAADAAGIFKNLGLSFAIQMVSWGIGPFLLALWGYVSLLRNAESRRRYLAPLSFLTVFLLFFIYVATAEVLLPHWMLICFILLIPLTFAHYLQENRRRKSLLIGTLVSAGLTLTLLVELAFQVFPARWTASAYEGIYGWKDVMAEANRHLAAVENPKKGLAVMNWTLGSRAMYYNTSVDGAPAAPVFVIDSRQDQFDIWTPQSPVGYDLIAVVEAGKKDEHLAHLNCAQLTSVGEKTSIMRNVPVNRFLYFHCANFLGYK